MVTESMRNCRKQSSDDGNRAVWELVGTVAASVAMATVAESVSADDRSQSWADFLATDTSEMING